MTAFITCLLATSSNAQTAAQTGNPPGTPAEDPRYRIELIVLMHLDHSEEPRRMRWLEDYSTALDLLTPEPEKENGDAAAAEGSQLAGSLPDAAAQGAPDGPPADSSLTDGDALAVDGLALEAEVEDDPLGGVVHVPEPGAQMQDAWRRLRLSGPFRPLQYLAWEQSASAPFPVLRVHNGEAVLVQDPWAEERAALEAGVAATGNPSAPTPGDVPDGEAGDGAEESGLPPPIQFFRLDGTAQLTRSRFLHLALNVEWREPIFEPDFGPGFGDPSLPSPAVPPDRPSSRLPGPEAEAAPPPADAFDIHRLEQSRQVRLRRMEYFDGPVLGVLAWVTRVNASTGQEVQAADEADLARVE